MDRIVLVACERAVDRRTVRVVIGARYDAVAATYGAEADPSTVPTTSAVLQLLGDVRGARVLDLACGHGSVARELARRGARVVGVDMASGLIARGRRAEAAEPLGVHYVEADAASAGTLRGERFDSVVCHFGLSDIDDLDGVCGTVRRLLPSGGCFVFAILHPCFPGIGDVSGSWPTGGRYFDEGWWRADGELSVLRRVVGANHRTLSTYVNMLLRHGLRLDRLEEPPPAPAWTATRRGVECLPLYLVARCVAT
jgi:SAM-dependent methyltransferase